MQLRPSCCLPMHPVEAGAVSVVPMLRWGASSAATGSYLVAAVVYSASLGSALRTLDATFRLAMARRD